jgi:hypothetical protein
MQNLPLKGDSMISESAINNIYKQIYKTEYNLRCINSLIESGYSCFDAKTEAKNRLIKLQTQVDSFKKSVRVYLISLQDEARRLLKQNPEATTIYTHMSNIDIYHAYYKTFGVDKSDELFYFPQITLDDKNFYLLKGISDDSNIPSELFIDREFTKNACSGKMNGEK